MERKLLGLAGRLDVLEALREFVVGFFPRDAAPLAGAARSDALQWIEQAFGMVLVVERCLTAGAQLAARVGVVGVAFDLQDAAILDVAGDAADR